MTLKYMFYIHIAQRNKAYQYINNAISGWYNYV